MIILKWILVIFSLIAIWGIILLNMEGQGSPDDFWGSIYAFGVAVVLGYDLYEYHKAKRARTRKLEQMADKLDG